MVCFEAGVRQLRQLLEKVTRKAALRDADHSSISMI